MPYSKNTIKSQTDQKRPQRILLLQTDQSAKRLPKTRDIPRIHIKSPGTNHHKADDTSKILIAEKKP